MGALVVDENMAVFGPGTWDFHADLIRIPDLNLHVHMVTCRRPWFAISCSGLSLSNLFGKVQARNVMSYRSSPQLKVFLAPPKPQKVNFRHATKGLSHWV